MFSGKVYLIQDIKHLRLADDAVEQVIEAFKTYWVNGFHPDIGRDVITSRPNPPDGHRHAHVVPLVSDTSSRSSWKYWSSSKAKDEDFIAVDSNTNKIPTSDRLLFYFVDESRNAYVFMYCPDDGHAYMNSREFTDLVEDVAAYLESEGVWLMNYTDQHRIWDDQWWSE